MSCGPPPSISNGYTETSYRAGVSTIKYACNTGYSMRGGSAINCLPVASPPPGGSGSSNAWTEAPVCSLEFLQSTWFWLMAGITGLLFLGVLSCLIYLCVRYCCGGCRAHRRGRVKDIEGAEEDRYGCCRTDCCGCLTTCACCCEPEETMGETNCCDYNGCCGYGGCCACCCWCCRCCREEKPSGISSWRRPKPRFLAKRGSSAKGKKPKNKSNTKKKGILKRSNVLPTTRTVHALMQNETASFRKQALVLPVWKPFQNPVRKINTSTK